MAYAETTSVAFEKSVGEIVALVKRAGAMQVAQQDMEDSYTIAFRLDDRLIKFRLPLPMLDQIPTRDGRGSALSAQARQSKLDQAKRQKGRALLLVIKAKLESVESGIETIEQAFLANVVLSDGMTVYERVSQPIAIEYQQGRPDTTIGLLPPPGGQR